MADSGIAKAIDYNLNPWVGLEQYLLGGDVPATVDQAQWHEPWAYPMDVLTRLPMQLNSRIEELLPHNWRTVG